MRKILLFFLVATISAIGMPANAQQVSEGFEGNSFPPAGWKSVLVKGDVNWASSSSKPHLGKNSAYMGYELVSNSGAGQGDSWLITPLIYQIVAGDKITFFLAPEYLDNMTPPYFEQIQVYVSTTGNNPANFTTLLLTIDLNALAAGYTQFTINFPASVYGQNVYVGLRHTQNEGNGVFLDDFSAGTKLANDIGRYKINLDNDAVFPTGSTINIADTLINNGTATIPAGIPISYQVNGGSPVTTTTTASISPGSTAFVNFTGSNAFVPTSPGVYQLKVYADWGLDINKGNDTMTYNLTVQTPKTAFPYFTDFDNSPDWTLAGSAMFQYSKSLINAGQPNPVINPAGYNDSAVFAFTYTSLNQTFIIRTPLLDFTGINKPMMNFYVASSPYSASYNDTLQVMVSTDGGATYQSPLYTKSSTTNSKLATVQADNLYFYVPGSANDWRHEIVDLSRYANASNVMVAFKVISHGGNNVWLDNVNIIDQPAAFYTSTRVTAPSTVTGPFNTKVQLVTIPAADSLRIEANITQPDSRFSEGDKIETNISSTSNDGTITSPDVIFDRYFTIAYSGNTITRATYNISLDVSSIPGIFPGMLDKLYILKRADETGRWVALNTTRVGNILTSTGLTKFSDFAIGYNSIAVPVTVLSFTGKATENVVELNWNTSQEANILSYDIQRWNGNDWIKIGTKASSKTSMQNQYTFTDENAPVGLNLYRLRINSEIGSSAFSDIAKVMVSFSGNKVYQNIPNPVRNYTIIKYDLAKSANVKIVVYDARGSQVAQLENAAKQAGTYQARWDASNVAAGSYFYRVFIDNEVVSMSMLKIK